MIQAGTGTVTLSGNNSYSGVTTVSAGTLQAGSATAFSANSNYTVTSILNLAGFSNSVGSLAGTGTVTNTTGAATLSTEGNGTSTVFSGTLQNGGGTLGLNKLGAGTLTLSGTSTYTGATTVAPGPCWRAPPQPSAQTLISRSPDSWTWVASQTRLVL